MRVEAMPERTRRRCATLLVAAALASACRRGSRLGSDAGAPTTTSTERAAIAPADAGEAEPAGTDPDAESARRKRAALVRSIEVRGYVKSARVLEELGRVPRHLFLPGASLEEAYGDWPLAIGSGQTISQPSVVGEMTEALELRGAERVLEIGTGSGYQAAVLSGLAREVYTIELVPELHERAEKRLRELGYRNVHVRVGDGYRGWPEESPFERVILTAAPPQVPKALLEQLAEGGVLVAPVGPQGQPQWLVRMRKRAGQVTQERLEEVRFVPMVRGR
jgi:protein-L-isoaspartate(D-aspartate) O-methyltransferase